MKWYHSKTFKTETEQVGKWFQESLERIFIFGEGEYPIINICETLIIFWNVARVLKLRLNISGCKQNCYVVFWTKLSNALTLLIILYIFEPILILPRQSNTANGRRCRLIFILFWWLADLIWNRMALEGQNTSRLNKLSHSQKRRMFCCYNHNCRALTLTTHSH